MGTAREPSINDLTQRGGGCKAFRDNSALGLWNNHDKGGESKKLPKFV